MKLNQSSGMTIALAAAALIVSGATLAGPSFAAEGAKGHCVGANACKGQGGCKTAKNDCKSLNACKGQGWLELTEEDCAKQGGTFEKS